jgi:dihydroorotate dehydrogenase (fumarate)
MEKNGERRIIMDLKVTFDGITLENPLMPASGPIVGDSEKLLFLQNEGVGALVTKTISVKEPHIPRPCIYGDKNFVMNSELWSEHSYTLWVEEFLPELKKKKDRPMIISVGYTKEDMEFLIPKLDPFADAFEVSTHYVGTDLSVIASTVKTIRKHTKKPVYMKISPHIPNPIGFAEAVKAAGANGLVAINSLGPTMKIDVASRSIKYAPESGYVWMSGPVIKNLALATVYKIKQAMPDFTVIGVGGIINAEDILEFLLAGADAVQMLSGALLRGKDLYKKILDKLPKVLEKHGFSSIEDVKNTVLNNPVTYEKTVPVLDVEKCTECNLCVRVCPYFAITMKDKITFDHDKCFGCGLCISKCPTKALS